MTNNQAITIALNTECHLVMKDWQQGKLAPQHQLDAIESMTDYLHRSAEAVGATAHLAVSVELKQRRMDAK